MFCVMSPLVCYCQCDVTLKPSENPKVAYKTRGERCEGTYDAKVGAPSLEVVGFTIGAFSYRLERAELIQIKNPAGSTCFIRASALPLNTYYRMDAALEKDQTLRWPVKDVLFDLQIPSYAAGVYGWMGTEKAKVYVPVQAVSSTHTPSDRKLYLIIRPSARVADVKYRYAPSGGSFSPYESSTGSRQQGKLIVLVLPQTLKGDYRLEVAAQLESKSDWVKNQYQLFIQ